MLKGLEGLNSGCPVLQRLFPDTTSKAVITIGRRDLLCLSREAVGNERYLTDGIVLSVCARVLDFAGKGCGVQLMDSQFMASVSELHQWPQMLQTWSQVWSPLKSSQSGVGSISSATARRRTNKSVLKGTRPGKRRKIVSVMDDENLTESESGSDCDTKVDPDLALQNVISRVVRKAIQQLLEDEKEAAYIPWSVMRDGHPHWCSVLAYKCGKILLYNSFADNYDTICNDHVMSSLQLFINGWRAGASLGPLAPTDFKIIKHSRHDQYGIDECGLHVSLFLAECLKCEAAAVFHTLQKIAWVRTWVVRDLYESVCIDDVDTSASAEDLLKKMDLLVKECLDVTELDINTAERTFQDIQKRFEKFSHRHALLSMYKRDFTSVLDFETLCYNIIKDATVDVNWNSLPVNSYNGRRDCLRALDNTRTRIWNEHGEKRRAEIKRNHRARCELAQKTYWETVRLPLLMEAAQKWSSSGNAYNDVLEKIQSSTIARIEACKQLQDDSNSPLLLGEFASSLSTTFMEIYEGQGRTNHGDGEDEGYARYHSSKRYLRSKLIHAGMGDVKYRTCIGYDGQKKKTKVRCLMDQLDQFMVIHQLGFDDPDTDGAAVTKLNDAVKLFEQWSKHEEDVGKDEDVSEDPAMRGSSDNKRPRTESNDVRPRKSQRKNR